MKKNNLNIYYGIVFLFLYSRIYSIFANLFVCTILFLKINIFVLPFVLFVIGFIMLILFNKIKKFTYIRLWMIILIFTVYGLSSYFFDPAKFYDGEPKKHVLIINFLTSSKFLFEILIIIIAYLKYRKILSSSPQSAKKSVILCFEYLKTIIKKSSVRRTFLLLGIVCK